MILAKESLLSGPTQIVQQLLNNLQKIIGKLSDSCRTIEVRMLKKYDSASNCPTAVGQLFRGENATGCFQRGDKK